MEDLMKYTDYYFEGMKCQLSDLRSVYSDKTTYLSLLPKDIINYIIDIISGKYNNLNKSKILNAFFNGISWHYEKKYYQVQHWLMQYDDKYIIFRILHNSVESFDLYVCHAYNIYIDRYITMKIKDKYIIFYYYVNASRFDSATIKKNSKKWNKVLYKVPIEKIELYKVYNYIAPIPKTQKELYLDSIKKFIEI